VQAAQSVDCGVFCLHFLVKLASGNRDFTISRANVNWYRQLMAIEILRGALFY
jgi:Ulp1 family protease